MENKKNINFSPLSIPKIYQNRKFSKNDLLFKDFIINNILENENKIISINKKNLQKILNLNSYETVDEFLNKFKIKHYIFSIESKTFLPISGFFNILDGIVKIDNDYNFLISNTFYNILIDPENELKKYKIDILLKFSNINTSSFYSFITQFIKERTFKISLNNLKKIMKIDESKYSRFYDFENKIFKNTLVEIKKYGNIDIKYKKITNNNKIIGISIELKDLEEEFKNKKIKIIENMIKGLCEDEYTIMNFIKKEINNKPFNKILGNVNYALLHKKTNFDANLISSIKYDALNNEFDNKLNEYKNEYKIVVKKNIKIKNIENFKKIIIDEVQDTNLKEVSKFIKFLKDIFDLYKNSVFIPEGVTNNYIYKEIFLALETKNEFIFQHYNILIIGEFNGEYNSNFAILSK